MVRDIEHCEITLGRRPRPDASRQGRGVGALIRSGLLSRVSYLRLLPIVAVLAGAGISSAQSLATVVEPRSNTPFPASLMPPGGTTEHRLTGTGLREHVILFIGVHVYAFGLYVDADRARVALAEFAGRSPVELAGDERFYRRLLDQEFAMTLRLVMVRTVAGVDVANAFDNALRPQVSTDPDDLRAVERFRGYFDAPEIATGTEIVFACTPSGRLSTTVAGAERESIDSRVLCRALFGVYLGAVPISIEGKKTVVAGFAELLASR